MQAVVKKSILSNLTLKIVSCIIAYGMWHVASESRAINISLDVPVCFYTVPNTIAIDAPEQVTVHLLGRRADLYALDVQSLALHINGTTLHEGPNALAITPSTLFLPERIKLVNYSPLNAVINVHTKQETTSA